MGPCLRFLQTGVIQSVLFSIVLILKDSKLNCSTFHFKMTVKTWTQIKKNTERVGTMVEGIAGGREMSDFLFAYII